MFLHMIVPEKNEDFIKSSGQDYKISNSSSFHKKEKFDKNKSNKDSINNKQVFYEVGCRIFEINKIYK